MKATLATLACLLTAGLLTAASVDGNNTAVVIRKNVVQSDTGFQFLCVPVNGLNIAGVNGGTVKLSTMLPPETLTAGTKISLVNSTGSVTQEAAISSVEGVNTWSTDLDLSGGQIFWLKVGEDAEAANQEEASVASLSLFATAGQEEEAANGETEPIVFCGQDRTRSPITPGLGVLTPMSNDSSVPLKLSEVNANPVNLDTIMTIKSGSSDYELYDYFGGVWYGPMGEPCNDVEIAPGEAFYYFKRY